MTITEELKHLIRNRILRIKYADIGKTEDIPTTSFCLTKISTPQTEWAVILYEDREGDFTKAIFIPSSEFDIEERVYDAIESLISEI